MKTLPMNASIVDTNEATGLQPGLTLNVSQLDRCKRGDFIRIMVKHQDGQAKSKEILTCLVTQKIPGSGVIQCKIFSAPGLTHCHGLEYGDELTIAERCVLEHEVSDPQRVESLEHFLTGIAETPHALNAEDQKLRDATQNMKPLPPRPRKQYWLRNGLTASVWDFYAESGKWLGNLENGQQMSWNQDGSSTQGPDFDIVRDPTAIEVKE